MGRSLQGLLNLPREIVAFCFFFLYFKKKKRDIVFYAEDKASYSYFEGLVDQLTNVNNLPVCYVTSDPRDPLFRINKKNLKVIYINKLLFLFTIILNSKLLIMTMPDLHQLHVRRSERGTHHVYLFHNIGSSFPVIKFGALFYYDTIFCSGPHHNEEIRKQEELYSLNQKEPFQFRLL